MSAQPVAPSLGISSLTGTFAPCERDRLVRPGRADDRVAVLEQVDLVRGQRPVLLDQRLLLLEQVDRRVELRLGELVRVGDAEVGCVFDRYSAASAIWIGLSGTVTLPLYFVS